MPTITGINIGISLFQSHSKVGRLFMPAITSKNIGISLFQSHSKVGRLFLCLQ